MFKDKEPYVYGSNWFLDFLHTAFVGSSDSLSDISFFNGLDNLLTGNADYARSLEALEKEQAFNAAEADKARQWQLDMSNTAYQRQAQDLEQAGYNPALALGAGGATGYSTSSASSASTPSYHSGGGFGDILRIFAQSINTAYQISAMNERSQQKLEASREIQLLRNNNALDLAKFNSNVKEHFQKNQFQNQKFLQDLKNKNNIDLANYNGNLKTLLQNERLSQKEKLFDRNQDYKEINRVNGATEKLNLEHLRHKYKMDEIGQSGIHKMYIEYLKNKKYLTDEEYLFLKNNI